MTRSWKRRCTGPHCWPSQMLARSVISSSEQPSCLARAMNASRASGGRRRAGSRRPAPGGSHEADLLVVAQRRRAEPAALGDVTDRVVAHPVNLRVRPDLKVNREVVVIRRPMSATRRGARADELDERRLGVPRPGLPQLGPLERRRAVEEHLTHAHADRRLGRATVLGPSARTSGAFVITASPSTRNVWASGRRKMRPTAGFSTMFSSESRRLLPAKSGTARWRSSMTRTKPGVPPSGTPSPGCRHRRWPRTRTGPRRASPARREVIQLLLSHQLRRRPIQLAQLADGVDGW